MKPISPTLNSTLKLAREWVDLLDGPHVIIPPPVISRAQILDVSRAYLVLAAEAELGQRRYEWLRDNAMFDNRWVEISNEEFDAKVDAHIAEDLK